MTYRHPEVARLLLEHRADPSVRNSAGDTPLGIALSRNDLEMIDLLKAAGAEK